MTDYKKNPRPCMRFRFSKVAMTAKTFLLFVLYYRVLFCLRIIPSRSGEPILGKRRTAR